MVKMGKSINPNSDGVLQTKNLILRSMCFVYLSAFLGFYCQSPGLFGSNGILPARNQIESRSIMSGIHKKPTLLYFSSYLGLNTDYMIDLLSLLGVIISFAGFVSQTFCLLPTFAALWSLYFSLVQVLQSFDHQSDQLLLEAGFLCLFLAPFNSTRKSGIADKIGIVLLKWLAFRFLFESGSVKFFSGCPYWWSFTGLTKHFETLPIPTPFSWFCHHLPPKYLKITMLFTHLTELVCPWFFFFPSRAVRVLLFYWEIYLQLTIILSGNYGFLNFLVITLLFTLLDDKFFEEKSKTRAIMGTFFTMIVFTIIFYIVHASFGSNLEKLVFKYEHLAILRSMLRLSPLVAVAAVVTTFLSNIISHPSIRNARGFWAKASQVNILLVFTFCALALIGVTVVPHCNLDATTNVTNTYRHLSGYYRDVHKYNIVNEYGRHLRRMRPERIEVILQYKTKPNDEWIDLPFLYKPWTTDDTTVYAGPYLPRLDMKFYDLINTNYQEELWVLSLAYRILQNEPNVLNLLGIKGELKPEPKFIRAIKNRFKYTPLSERDESTLWIKKVSGEYIPELSIDSEKLQSYMKKMKITGHSRRQELRNILLKNVLDFIRLQSQKIDPHLLIFGIIIAGLVITISRK